MITLQKTNQPSLFKPGSEKAHLQVKKITEGNLVRYFFDAINDKKQASKNAVLIAALPEFARWIQPKTSVTYKITGETQSTAIWSDRSLSPHIHRIEGQSALLEAVALADLKKSGILWFGGKEMVAGGRNFFDLKEAGLDEKTSAPVSLAGQRFLAVAEKAAHEFYERENLSKDANAPWDGLSELYRPPKHGAVDDNSKKIKIRYNEEGETTLHNLK